MSIKLFCFGNAYIAYIYSVNLFLQVSLSLYNIPWKKNLQAFQFEVDKKDKELCHVKETLDWNPTSAWRLSEAEHEETVSLNGQEATSTTHLQCSCRAWMSSVAHGELMSNLLPESFFLKDLLLKFKYNS